MPQAKPSTKMEPDSQKWALAEATVNMKLSGNTIAPAAEWIPPPLLAAQQQAHWMNADGQYPLQDPSRLEASPDLMWNSESSGTAAAPSARRSVDFGAKIKQPSSLWSDGAIWGAAGTSTMLARSQSALQQTSELLMDKQLSHHNPSLKHYEEEVRRKGSLPNLKMQDNMPQQDWHDASAAAQPKRATVTGGLLRTSYAGQLAGMPEFYGLRSGSSARPGLESVFPQRVGTPSTQTSMHKANGDQGMSRAQRFDVTSFDLGMAQGAPQASQQLQQPHQLQPHLFPGQQQSLSISPSIWVGHEQTGATSSSASSTSFWPPTPTSTAASIGQPPQWTF
ncbi:hypothetical protein DFJ73DRAFT_251049 [Zopfochytrium polystomum]|nr:hypothetical protein DFJ73DRAFT_251049 [Zopfochytrium polystomum]